MVELYHKSISPDEWKLRSTRTALPHSYSNLIRTCLFSTSSTQVEVERVHDLEAQIRALTKAKRDAENLNLELVSSLRNATKSDAETRAMGLLHAKAQPVL